jgi:hypothetical protein
VGQGAFQGRFAEYCKMQNWSLLEHFAWEGGFACLRTGQLGLKRATGFSTKNPEHKSSKSE